MGNHWLSYWKPATADSRAERGGLLDHAGSAQYWRVEEGDTVWIVTVRSGVLHLLGGLEVGRVTDRPGAARALGRNDLWDAPHFVLAAAGTARPIAERPLGDQAARLRFESASGKDRLDVREGRVDSRQLQTLRRLAPASGRLLRGVLGDHHAEPAPKPKAPTAPEVGAAKASPARRTAAEPPPGTALEGTATPRPMQVRGVLARLQAVAKRSPHLIKREYYDPDRENPLDGFCYALSECLFHLFPGVFTTHCITWEGGGSHWFLRRAEDRTILDPTHPRGEPDFEETDEEHYESARRRPFLPQTPSERARELARLAGFTLPPRRRR